MTNTKKMTKRDFFEALYTEVQESGFFTETATNEQFLEFLAHEVELLNKKNSGERKPTPQQIENAKICEAILANLANGEAYTITEMLKQIPECADISNQRCAALVRSLIEDGKVERFEDHRKAYFRMV